MSDRPTPQLGDVAIHTYAYKGNTYREYVMYRRLPGNYINMGWCDVQGERVADGEAVQPLPSAEELRTTLGLPGWPSYTPKIGDVATYRSSSGFVVSIHYRRDGRRRPDDLGWFQANGAAIPNAEKDPSFQLILRDGKLQEGINI